MEVSKMAIKWLSSLFLGLLFLFGGGIGWIGRGEISVPIMYVYWHLIWVPLCVNAVYLYMSLSSSKFQPNLIFVVLFCTFAGVVVRGWEGDWGSYMQKITRNHQQ
jgi:hypothetical protein